MKKELVATGFAVFCFTLPQKAIAANFSQFFVFGDSLSDTGNVFNVSGGQIPISPPYFQGRFSNDKIWVDYLGKDLGLTPTLVTSLPQDFSTIPPTQGINFAFGGANSGKGNAVVPSVPLPGVLEQVGLFRQSLIATNQKADPNALYAVWGGGNDYLLGGVTDVNQTVKNLSDSVGALASAGAKNILVFNLPDLGRVPAATVNPSALTNLTLEHNQKLAAALSNFNSNGVNIITIDTNSLFNRVLANPGEFGFKNTVAPCVIGTLNKVDSVCQNPNDFVFFDALHPTTNVHRLIAETALAAVEGKSIPEPSAALGILALGALGAAGVRQRKLTSTSGVVEAKPSRIR